MEITSNTVTHQYYRSQKYKSIAGVCAGIAISRGWSITLVRMVMLALLWATGLGLVLYVLGWIFIPTHPQESQVKDADLALVDPLRRSQSSKVLGGVCGGLAEFLKADVSLIRILFCVLFLSAGIGILPYLYAWVVLPQKA